MSRQRHFREPRVLSAIALIQQLTRDEIITERLSMKTLIFLLCILSGALSGQSQKSGDSSPAPTPQYFPAGVFNTSTQSSKDFRDKWYSFTLRALHEPSLFALRNDQSLQVYRFLWLPSFHRPISIRLTINAYGSGSIVARSVDNHAGLLTKPASDTGELILDQTVAIDKIQAQDVLQRLQLLAFWSLPTEEEQQAPQSSGESDGPRLRVVQVDGSQWILEGLREGEYHVVDRWSPQANSYSQLCKHLLQLGKVETTLY